MKHNQKKGDFHRGGPSQKNDKFFKRQTDNNKFKPWKKDQGDKPNFQKGGFNKNFKKYDKKQNKPSFIPRKPEDKGGYRLYKNRDGFADNRNNDNRNPNTKGSNFNKNGKLDRKPFTKNFQSKSGEKNFNRDRNSGFNKTNQNKFDKNRPHHNQQKHKTMDNNEDMGLEEAPKIHYCLAPEVLQSRLKETQTAQEKNKKVDKREEYLKQKQRRNDILKQKTRKGQPVMGPRMQLLYEKVQKVVSKDNNCE